VAEAIRLYGRRFWLSLALGLSRATLNQLSALASRTGQLLLTATVGAVLLSGAFAAASVIVVQRRPPLRNLLVAIGVGCVVFSPAPFLALFFILPAVAWLALFGLAVPAAVVEGIGVRASVARGLALARADYVHALGSLATLAITYFLTRLVLVFLLRGQADNTIRVAAFLADLVVSPLLFLGAALLYFDQAARLVSSRTQGRKRRSNANLHPAFDAHVTGRPDTAVEPRAAPRGEP